MDDSTRRLGWPSPFADADNEEHKTLEKPLDNARLS